MVRCRSKFTAIGPSVHERLLGVATSPEWQQSARQLVDILINGSRPIK